jgi:hypothetical protein
MVGWTDQCRPRQQSRDGDEFALETAVGAQQNTRRPAAQDGGWR